MFKRVLMQMSLLRSSWMRLLWWLILLKVLFFLFKKKTANEMRMSDWSSDVCSSDLELYARTRARGRAAIWEHLRGAEGELPAATMEALRHLLGMADFTTPFRFLETLLSGPIDGRRKLYARLGREARDPIDELLSQALAFETRETVSLLG